MAIRNKIESQKTLSWAEQMITVCYNITSRVQQMYILKSISCRTAGVGFQTRTSQLQGRHANNYHRAVPYFTIISSFVIQMTFRCFDIWVSWSALNHHFFFFYITKLTVTCSPPLPVWDWQLALISRDKSGGRKPQSWSAFLRWQLPFLCCLDDGDDEADLTSLTTMFPVALTVHIAFKAFCSWMQQSCSAATFFLMAFSLHRPSLIEKRHQMRLELLAPAWQMSWNTGDVKSCHTPVQMLGFWSTKTRSIIWELFLYIFPIRMSESVY